MTGFVDLLSQSQAHPCQRDGNFDVNRLTTSPEASIRNPIPEILSNEVVAVDAFKKVDENSALVPELLQWPSRQSIGGGQADLMNMRKKSIEFPQERWNRGFVLHEPEKTFDAVDFDPICLDHLPCLSCNLT